MLVFYLLLVLIVCSSIDAASIVKLEPRQASCSRQQQISEDGQKDPVKAAGEVLKISGILNPNESLWYKNNIVTGDADDKQVPWGKGAKFNGNPWVFGTYLTGYLGLPLFFGDFKLDRSHVIRSNGSKVAKAPVYVNANHDPKKIERAVIIWPGQWRDSWRFINLLGNAYAVAQKYPDLDVQSDNVLMISPVFMNQLDKKAGAVQKNEIYFKDSGWAIGGTSRGPPGFEGINSFAVMDYFVDYVFNTTHFPNLKHAVIAGHSMGGQASLRYGIVRKPQKHDDRLSFWVGNPGSYLYMDDKRMGSNSTSGNCSTTNDWPAGLNGKKAPAYVKGDLKDVQKIIDRFEGRSVHYAFGMNDNGGQSDQCETNAQGPNRIARAAYWVEWLADLYGKFPSKQTVDFVKCVSHQDYPMLATYQSLYYLFSSKSD